MGREAGRRGTSIVVEHLTHESYFILVAAEGMQGQGKHLTWTRSEKNLLLLNVLRGLGQVQPFITEECLGVFP